MSISRLISGHFSSLFEKGDIMSISEVIRARKFSFLEMVIAVFGTIATAGFLFVSLCAQEKTNSAISIGASIIYGAALIWIIHAFQKRHR